ncbi:extradiol dioxygenase [Planococcus sp. CPCC 101016]|uniref:VOC family protein n=1 Tax=Planococcus sp. CPCC 101016 TaxID=2599617 RepID=UPI0011B530A1|nr:VOC family protein [Planococcus sp. CPCC 101016]TWT07946.1 extradiol dioxygenase [Planococcus sp. CPCC 101016]
MKELWINLPVKDLNRSSEFFDKIGVTVMERDDNNNEMVGLVVGQHQVHVMLVLEERFKRFTRNELMDADQSTEALFSISVETRDELDEIIGKVKQAGGFVFAEPAEQSGYYGAGFADLDGHRWNLLVM